jgi:hypothetical protein
MALVAPGFRAVRVVEVRQRLKGNWRLWRSNCLNLCFGIDCEIFKSLPTTRGKRLDPRTTVLKSSLAVESYCCPFSDYRLWCPGLSCHPCLCHLVYLAWNPPFRELLTTLHDSVPPNIAYQVIALKPGYKGFETADFCAVSMILGLTQVSLQCVRQRLSRREPISADRN